MENNDFTLSEAKKITGELKATILKLETLNNESKSNLKELEKINIHLNKYTKIIKKFDSKTEDDLTENYAIYLSFLTKKIDELSKNNNLKRIENIILILEKIINFSIIKFLAVVAASFVAFYIFNQIIK